jgi:hypothetical protein
LMEAAGEDARLMPEHPNEDMSRAI